MSRTFAIGDVHGRADLLHRAIDHIRQSDPDGLIVMLGDYVDRGPDSRRVVERLMGEHAAGGLIALLGNHDLMMVEAVRAGDPVRMAWWLGNGGDATLKSYGSLDVVQAELAKVPAVHLDWLASRPLYHLDRHRLF